MSRFASYKDLLRIQRWNRQTRWIAMGTCLLGSGAAVLSYTAVRQKTIEKQCSQMLESYLLDCGLDGTIGSLEFNRTSLHFMSLSLYIDTAITITGLSIRNPKDLIETGSLTQKEFVTIESIQVPLRVSLSSLSMRVTDTIHCHNVTLHLERTRLKPSSNYSTILKRMDAAATASSTAVSSVPYEPLTVVLNTLKVYLYLVPEANFTPDSNIGRVSVKLPKLIVTDHGKVLNEQDFRMVSFAMTKTIVLTALLAIKDLLPTAYLKQMGSLGIDSVKTIGKTFSIVAKASGQGSFKVFQTVTNQAKILIEGSFKGFTSIVNSASSGVKDALSSHNHSKHISASDSMDKSKSVLSSKAPT